jgi:hypothetical protein
MNARTALSTWPTLDGAQRAKVPEYIEPDWPKVRVRCVQPFMLEGKRIEVGEDVNLILPLANDLLARGRVESLK